MSCPSDKRNKRHLDYKNAWMLNKHSNNDIAKCIVLRVTIIRKKYIVLINPKTIILAIQHVIK